MTRAEYQREWKKNNPERCAGYGRKHYLKNRVALLKRQSERRKKENSKVREIERKSQARRYAENPEAFRGYRKNWRKKNLSKERARERKSRKEYVQKNKEKIRSEKRAQLLNLYGITPAQFQKMEEQPGGKRGICGLRVKLCVDHNHDTGQVRGLLCRKCNSGIGMLQDSKSVLAKALKYLKYGPPGK